MIKMQVRIITFLKYIPLLKKLVLRDIKVRYKKSILGLLWTLLNPLFMMIIMNVVFSNVFNNNIENFPVYVMIGNVIFGFNSEATSQSLNSILINAPLIKKVYIPKYLFPMSKVVSAMVNLSFSLIALFIVMICTNARFPITIFYVPIPLLYMLLFVLGFSLVLSSLNVFFRDLGHLYGVFLTAWMYFTPIFYSVEILPESVRNLIHYNPMFYYISFFRKIIMDGQLPGIADNLICFFYGVAWLIVGVLVFKKGQDKFILYI